MTQSFNPREIFAEKWKRVQTKGCTRMFKAAFLVAAPNCKRPRCPSTGERLNTLWYIHIMEYFTAVKMNEPLIHTSWMNLQGVMLSEKSQFQNVTYYITTFT